MGPNLLGVHGLRAQVGTFSCHVLVMAGGGGGGGSNIPFLHGTACHSFRAHA